MSGSGRLWEEAWAAGENRKNMQEFTSFQRERTFTETGYSNPARVRFLLWFYDYLIPNLDALDLSLLVSATELCKQRSVRTDTTIKTLEKHPNTPSSSLSTIASVFFYYFSMPFIFSREGIRFSRPLLLQFQQKDLHPFYQKRLGYRFRCDKKKC